MARHELIEPMVPACPEYLIVHELYPGVDRQIAGFTEVSEHLKGTAAVMAGCEVEPQGRFLRDFRQHITTIGAHASARLDTYLDQTVSQFFASQAARMESNTGHWKRWLQSVEDPLLINFLEAHLHMVSQQQTDLRIIETVGKRKQEFKAEVTQAVANGYIHPDAYEATQDIDKVRVLIGGLVETVIPGDAAFHIDGTDYIMISPGAGPDEESRRRDVIERIRANDKHEYRHVMGYLPDDWLDEAVNSHIGAVMGDGWLDVVDPNKRAQLGSTSSATEYPHLRTLLATVLERDGRAVHPALSTWAYTGHRPERQNFEHAVDELWGVPQALKRISESVERSAAMFIQRGLSENQSDNQAALKTARALKTSPQQIFG